MVLSRKVLVFLSIGAAVLMLGCPSGNGNGDAGSIPEEVVELNILGTAYLGQFSWEPANEAFSSALELRRSDPLLLNNLAVTLVQQNRLDEAVELFEQALAIDTSFPWAHYNLGLLAKNDGDFAGAVGHFETVAAYDADDLHTQYNLASVLARLDRLEEAEVAFRNALEKNPTHVSTLYALGQFLMQNGRQEDGIELIQRSEEIRTRHGGDTIGIAYGEQGPYATGVDYPGDALAAPAAIDVRYEAGSSIAAAPDGAWTLGPFGGNISLIAAGNGTLHSLAGASAELDAPVGAIRALSAGDFDNDGSVDLVALVGDGSALNPHLRAGSGAWASNGFSKSGGIEGETAAIAAVDLDHDGDLDLFWCGESGCALAVNDGTANFEVGVSDVFGFSTGRLTAPIQVEFSDIDNDRDIDLLVADADEVRWFSNQRDGSFSSIGPDDGLGAGGGPIEIVDLDKNGTMDLVLSGPNGLRWLENSRGRFGSAEILAADVLGDFSVTDFDNDGFLDLVCSTEDGISVLHNRGTGIWDRRDDLFAEVGPGHSPLTSWDFDGDGDHDVVVRSPDGSVTLWINHGGNANRSLTITVEGVGDNHFGIGAKIEVLSGALRQKFERTRPVPLVVGLGQRDTVQSVRVLWPSGVLQDEVNLTAAEVATILQLDRKGTSCPLLYAWRDGAWRFVTDFLGGAAIGYQKAPGIFSTPDTDEYILIEQSLSEDDGWLKLRLNNQLEEVIWFDQAELVVVDHPIGSRVFPNERLMPAPPWPQFRLFASNDVRPIAAAHSVETSTSMTDRLSRNDGRTVDDFSLRPYKGYAESHALELDLGTFGQRQRVVLLLDGWIDYADSSANVTARQAGASLVPPRLSVIDGEGRWVEATGRMGFPAGLPKTMSVELTGLFASADHRIRIETNMRIYWDRARVMVGGEDLPLDVRRIAVASADLRHGGFPQPATTDGHKPLAYDPDQVASRGGWKAHVGAYTGFGNVAELLRDIDDAFVTTRNGDEIELKFAAPPPPAPGLTRTYLLFADGFGKDMDPNSAAATNLGPLPFHGMPSYPYGDEVIPPLRPRIEQPPPRLVRWAEDGLPGVPPQVLAAHIDAP
jgi:tetratricopeptide (TPR) repeat protein